VNTERLNGILHIAYGLMLFYLTKIDNPIHFFWVILVAMMFYMPTIALNNSISYTILKNNGNDIVKDFPPIRVWGTVGFIVAMWTTNLLGFKASVGQFYIGGIFAIALGIYSFTMPKCIPQKHIQEKKSFVQLFGLDAFKLFRDKKMALFFIFSMFLGAALQLTNAYGDVFLSEFSDFPKYANSFVVKYSTLIMSISQISETLFILTIPFFLKRFGIKIIMLFSMFAWVLRFAFFSFGNPSDGLWLIILSCVVYGMAFDFFNVSGSMFVDTSVDKKYRSSAQGIFMLMTNGIGAILGSLVSGWIIDTFFTLRFDNLNILSKHLETSPSNAILHTKLTEHGISVDATNQLSQIVTFKDWPVIWLSFAIYALIVAVLFAIFFKHKHNPEQNQSFAH
jgi:NHS family xanthosine MFS transporter